jgi:hypothetical protein
LSLDENIGGGRTRADLEGRAAINSRKMCIALIPREFIYPQEEEEGSIPNYDKT